MDDYRKIADIIKEKGNVVAFTGAGISVDSGIPAFRGGQGLWEKYDPMEYAHIGSFNRNPEKVWVMLREMSRIILDSKPSPAHIALGKLEKQGFLRSVITQNVDGLHQLSGNSTVIEYHGSNRWFVCSNCSKRFPLSYEIIDILPYPICDKCKHVLKPDLVFFGENIPRDAMINANEEAEKCKVMLVIGTSGVVYPAAEIPHTSKYKGATIVEINTETTFFTSSITDYFFKDTASEVLPKILTYLQ